jgi:hypothetical protein
MKRRTEDPLPPLLQDSRAIVEGQSHADPQVRTQRVYPRLSAAAVRRQLIAHKGYRDADVPTGQTLTATLKAVGAFPKNVAQSKPPQKSRPPPPSATS